jgi:D-threo-aldose 1-dehydrogenase
MPSDNEAMDSLSGAWDKGIRYFDTSPHYGRGQSEHRVGRFLYDIEPRDSFVLSTKVGRLFHRSVTRPYPPACQTS